jgi:hypothetical protein
MKRIIFELIFILALFFAGIYIGFRINLPIPESPKPMQANHLEYKKQIDTIRIKQIKLKTKYDTIEIHLRDSFYSTDFLQRAINLHRFIDTQERKPLFN